MVRSALEEKKARTFHVSWLRMYAFLFALEVLVLLVPIACGLLFRYVVPSLPLPLLIVVAVFDVFAAALITAVFSNEVGAKGLRGFNGWGGRCDMAWGEIASATPVNTLGLPWLIVRSKAGENANWLSWNVMWLPLFFADKRGFWETVAQFAPPDCPLLPPDSAASKP